MKPILLVAALVGTVVCGGCLRLLARPSYVRAGSYLPPAPGPSDVQRTRIAGLDVAYWQPCSTGKHPLILFSHGYKGVNTQTKFLCSYLAEHGYLVFAPNHGDSSLNGLGKDFDMKQFTDPAQWNDQKYRDRGEDLAKLQKALKGDPSWSQAIDWDKVGLMGHSLGGYTVLACSGAWPSWRLPGVKAVVALSPYCAPFVQQDTLKNIRVPVMYQGGTRDLGITPTVIKGGAAFDKTPSPTYFMELDGAGHFAWTDLNLRWKDSVDYYTEAFFDRYLRGGPGAPLKVKRDDVAVLEAK